MTSVFLTGGSGFLGEHVLRELRNAHCEVRALSRREESDRSLMALGAQPVHASLDDPTSLEQAMSGCEAVFHVAANTSLWPAESAAQTATNVQGTENMLRAARSAGVKAFMHTSSVAAWSHLVHAPIDESTPQRGGESWVNYERTKYLGELAVRDSKLRWIVFNPSHILGPGDRQSWAQLIMMIDRQKLPGIPPGLGAFADVREIAKAQVRAWQDQHFGQRYVLGGAHATFVDFVHLVGRTLDRRTPKSTTPASLLLMLGRLSDAWSKISHRKPHVTAAAAALTSHRMQVDSGKAIRELGYVETPLQPLLADTLAWMREEGMIGQA